MDDQLVLDVHEDDDVESTPLQVCRRVVMQLPVGNERRRASVRLGLLAFEAGVGGR